VANPHSTPHEGTPRSEIRQSLPLEAADGLAAEVPPALGLAEGVSGTVGPDVHAASSPTAASATTPRTNAARDDLTAARVDEILPNPAPPSINA